MTIGQANHLKDAADQFHMMMGYCIAEWARVEDNLFAICHAALSCPKQQAAVVYYRTPQLDARFSLVDELVRLVLPKHISGQPMHDDLKHWDAILKKFRTLTPMRNKVAHHPVAPRSASEFYSDVSYIDVPPECWFEIYEGANEQLRGRSNTPIALKLKDLQEHSVKVSEASTSLYKFFHRRLATHLAKPLLQ